MSLNDRKIKILEALITDYIVTGEPVSSRTIAKHYDLGISSATIRNEMSDLEEMGFIVQPHASSGRVPSDKGYRLHVDRIAELRELTNEETEYLKNVILGNTTHMEYLMKETAKAISVLTNYATIVSEVGLQKISIKYIQLMPMDSGAIVVTVITINKLIKNRVLNVSESPDIDMLNELTMILNKLLSGKTVEDMDGIIIEETSVHKSLLESVLATIREILTTEQEIEIFTSGVNNMLAFPEFNDIEKAKAIFKTFEEKEVLINLLDKNTSDSVQVVIGSENSLEEMKDLSLIRANYKIGNQPLGTIGIVGPKRMDYFTVTSVLNAVVKNVNSVLYALDMDKLRKM